MKDQTINFLLVDDNEDDVLLLSEALEKTSKLNIMQVLHDGEEAISFLRKEGPFADAEVPDVVLLDLNMPRKNGYEVLEEMKEDDALRNIPVIVMTVSQAEEDIMKAYSGGACSYLSKPIDYHKLEGQLAIFEVYWTEVAQLP